MTAGVFICLTCRDDGGEDCGEDCEAGHVEAIPPVWLDYWPTCGCCKREKHLLEVLTAVST